MDNLKEALLKEIEEDEREYCFDRSYCNDESWKEQNGNETREDAFNKAMLQFKGMTVESILDFFGDKYQNVVDKYK